jgi:sulfite reductase beta subunit-like hemoprotein
MVTVTLPLGDISGAHLRAVAQLAEAYADSQPDHSPSGQ